MRLFKILLPFFVFGFLFACNEPAPETSQLSAYDKDGVVFSYPSNWEVSQDQTFGDSRAIIVESPGTAIVTIEVLPSNDETTLLEWVDSMEIDTSDIVPGATSARTIEDRETSLGGQEQTGMRETLHVEGSGVELDFIRDFYQAETSERRAFLLTQAADEDLAKTQPGFDVLLDSFKLKQTSTPQP